MEPGISPLHPSPGLKDPRRKRQLEQQFAVFEVEGSIFRERRYGFEKWSDFPFPAMFAILKAKAGKGEVESEGNPIRLSACTAKEFELMYTTDDPTATLDKEDWIGMLKLVHLWNMPQLAAMAVDELSVCLTPFEKIAMGRASTHPVPRWVREGYTSIIGDLDEMKLEGLVEVLGWERTARVLWALKQAVFRPQPTHLVTGNVVDEIMREEFPRGWTEEIDASLRLKYIEAIPTPLRITVTQEQPGASTAFPISLGLASDELAVPRRAGTASIISFAPDGVYVSRTYDQAPIRVLQDFGYNAGWRVEKHVRLVGDTTGNGRSDIIAFGDTGVYISRNNGNGTFASPELILREFGYNNGWYVDKHLRYVVDLRKKGYVDILGFGDEGVYVALNRGNGTFYRSKLVLPDFGYNAGGWRLERHLRFLADVTGDGLPDIIGFGEDAIHVALNNDDGTFWESKVAVKSFATRWSVQEHPRTVANLTGTVKLWGYMSVLAFGICCSVVVNVHDI